MPVSSKTYSTIVRTSPQVTSHSGELSSGPASCAGRVPREAGAASARRAVRAQAREADVILAFVRSAAALGRELPALARGMRQGRTLWIVWPKKTSPLAGDLGEAKVREMGLAASLVDYKVCAVDETWCGLAFAARAAKRAQA